MKVIISIISLFLVSSCTSMLVGSTIKEYDVHGKIERNESKTDGRITYKLYSTYAHPIEGKYNFYSLGAFFSKDDNGGQYYFLSAEAYGAHSYREILFNIDGEKIKFPVEIGATSITSSGSEAYLYPVTQNFSRVKVPVKREFLEKLSKANKVFVKISFRDSYGEMTLTESESSKEWKESLKTFKKDFPGYVGYNYQNALKEFLRVTKDQSTIADMYDIDKRMESPSRKVSSNK